jgi:hypothetical protein
MFIYPKQAKVARVLPKNKIYAHSKASRALQARFVDQVDKITWRYKLAPESLNIPATKAVQEIQVFTILLKQQELHEDILRAIDRTIRHPIAYELRFMDQIRYVMPSKRPNEADPNKWVIDEYFWTDWQTTKEPEQSLPVVLNLGALYEHFLRSHLTIPARENEPLTEHVERIGLLQQKQREAKQLENRLHKTKQFNRKVELNQQLRSLKSEVEVLKL